MIKLISCFGFCFLISIIFGNSNALVDKKKVICFYDSKSHLREGQGKFITSDLDSALQLCTHLIYGFAAINGDTFKLVPLNENFDINKDNYRHITNLKQRNHQLKVYLSVGGGQDMSDETKDLKYRTLIESSSNRLTFINSAITLLKGYGFDGLDLAWQFPTTKPKKIRTRLGSAWHSFKGSLNLNDGPKDMNVEEHRDQFTVFSRELFNNFKDERLELSLSVLPNVNSTDYYHPQALSPFYNFINLLAFDYHTPERNPKEADVPAPLYELTDRRRDENVDAQVRYWINNGAPSQKIIVGIPTFARAWSLPDDTDLNGVPPLKAEGEALPGPHTKDAGLLSYTEVCTALGNRNGAPNTPHLKRITDSTKRKGTYAYYVPIPDENNNSGGNKGGGTGNGFSREGKGVWIGYEDVDAVGNKAAYVKAKGLGGVALFDLTLDDFRAVCNRESYILLRTAVSRL